MSAAGFTMRTADPGVEDGFGSLSIRDLRSHRRVPLVAEHQPRAPTRSTRSKMCVGLCLAARHATAVLLSATIGQLGRIFPTRNAPGCCWLGSESSRGTVRPSRLPVWLSFDGAVCAGRGGHASPVSCSDPSAAPSSGSRLRRRAPTGFSWWWRSVPSRRIFGSPSGKSMSIWMRRLASWS